MLVPLAACSSCTFRSPLRSRLTLRRYMEVTSALLWSVQRLHSSLAIMSFRSGRLVAALTAFDGFICSSVISASSSM
jgi:hypothetical protein